MPINGHTEYTDIHLDSARRAPGEPGVEEPQLEPGTDDRARQPEPSSHAPPAPATTDSQGQYIGPASGVSFLLRVQEQLGRDDFSSSAFTFGDAPLPEFDPTFSVIMSKEQTAQLVQKYFDFSVPVDRFLHRPTIQAWLDEFHETMGAMRDTEHAPARRAVLWMVFALAQEHMSQDQTAMDDSQRFAFTVHIPRVSAKLC